MKLPFYILHIMLQTNFRLNCFKMGQTISNLWPFSKFRPFSNLRPFQNGPDCFQTGHTSSKPARPFPNGTHSLKTSQTISKRDTPVQKQVGQFAVMEWLRIVERKAFFFFSFSFFFLFFTYNVEIISKQLYCSNSNYISKCTWHFNIAQVIL